MQLIQVYQAGGFVKQHFQECSRGKVLSTHSKIIYLLCENGELSWITDCQSPMHQRCLQITGQLPVLKAGSNYHVSNSSLVFEDCQLVMHQMDIWYPPLYPGKQLTLTEIIDFIHPTFNMIWTLENPKGLSRCLRDLVFTDEVLLEPRHDHNKDIFEEKFKDGLSAVISAGLKHSIEQFVAVATKNIGLGNGLTPSWDDFLGGLFFCLKYVEQMLSTSFLVWDQSQIDKLKSKTNLISFTIMADMMRGHGVDPLHELLGSMFIEKEKTVFIDQCKKLITIGNSTGWDILAGVMVGLLLIGDMNLERSPLKVFEQTPL